MGSIVRSVQIISKNCCKLNSCHECSGFKHLLFFFLRHSTEKQTNISPALPKSNSLSFQRHITRLDSYIKHKFLFSFITRMPSPENYCYRFSQKCVGFFKLDFFSVGIYEDMNKKALLANNKPLPHCT